MKSEKVSFYSEGKEIKGILRMPDEEASEKLPGIVQGPGFLGLKGSKLYIRFHEKLTEAGYTVLIFDYRGFGESEGEKGLLLPENQKQDWVNAITYLQTRSEVDENRIGIFGSGGTGGGNASYVASLDERALCTVCIHSVGDGKEWLHSMRREYEWVEFLKRIKENRKDRVLTGKDVLVDPREEITIATPERRKTTVKADVDKKIPQRIPFKSAEAIMNYKPEDFVHKISPRAIMWICLENDDVTPPSQSLRMYERAGQPKKLILLKGTSHYESYGVFFDRMMPEITDWYNKHLRYSEMEIL